MQFEPIVDARVAARCVFEREDHHTARSQRSRTSGDDLFEPPEVHQRIGRDDHIERVRVIAQELGELRLEQHVVDILVFRLGQHAR